MAELAVNIVFDRLIPLLRDEATLLRGVHGQIESIKDLLGLLRAYLKDADAKAERTDSSDLMKEWVNQVRKVAYRVEDVIDEYSFKVEKRGQKRGLDGVVSNTYHLFRSIVPRHEISDEIGEIRETLVRLNEGKETFGLDPSVVESNSEIGDQVYRRNDLRMGAYFMDDSQLVGVDETRKTLTEWLFDGETRRAVVSVVGEGGLGKTTIVNNVYRRQKDNRSFDCFAWFTISRTFREETLLKSMIESFSEGDNNNNDKMDKDSLINKLRQLLQEKSYMIVFDDVWDIDFWGCVEFALPDNNKNSRIMITTRDRGVAEFCKRFAPVRIHELQPLSPNDALTLFHLKVFQFDGHECPEELIELSKDFVKKCDRVPLAILAIAGVLSTTKKTVSEWQKVHASLQSKLASDPHIRSYHQVLSESYNYLPYHLKLCFLYFGLFPEDYSIPRTRLIYLWIAEGFVKQKDNEDQTQEEVAHEYLTELLRRSLIKVSFDLYPYNRVKRFRVHDLMHDFIRRKCDELNFCQVKKDDKFRIDTWSRRLSIEINNIDADEPESYANYGRVRSCFLFHFEKLPKQVVESLLSSFKLLVALDLEDAPLDYLPEPVGNLLHLKYLSIRNTRIQTIPKFIGKLQNLETLVLKESLVRELPVEIYKLVKLRHILAYSYHWEVHFFAAAVKGVKLKEGVGCLKALRKLSMIDTACRDDIIKELKNLKELRRLGIMNVRGQSGKMLCNAIACMKHLYSLSIETAGDKEVLDLNSLNDPPQMLQRLYLDGHLKALPIWISKLKNLVKLNLTKSAIESDPLPMLKDLTELEVLLLYKSYEGQELHFKDGWFKKLQCLRLRSLLGLRMLKIDKAALPSLELLQLQQSPLLVEMPVDIQNLKTLKVLNLREMPDQLIQSVKLEGSKCHSIVKNIPKVIYYTNGKLFQLTV